MLVLVQRLLIVISRHHARGRAAILITANKNTPVNVGAFNPDVTLNEFYFHCCFDSGFEYFSWLFNFNGLCLGFRIE